MKTNNNIAQKSTLQQQCVGFNQKLNKKLSVIAVLIGAVFCSPAMAYKDGTTNKNNTCVGNNSSNCNDVIIIGDDNNLNNHNPDSPVGGYGLVIGHKNNVDSSQHVQIVGDSNTINSVGNEQSGNIHGADIFGTHNNVENSSSIVVSGSRNNVDKSNNSIVTGNNNSLTGNESSIFGHGSTVNADNAVAIGNKSTNDRDNTVSFGSSGFERQLTNVKEGTADTDAVNVKQLNDKAQETLNSANSYTNNQITENNKVINQNIDNAKNEAINTSNDYTDNKFNQLSGKTDARFNQVDKRIAKLENKVNAGLAGVTAISSIPYVQEERFSFGMGLGNYSNGNAIAVGAQYKPSGNTNVRLNFSWDNESNSAIGAGFAVGW